MSGWLTGESKDPDQDTASQEEHTAITSGTKVCSLLPRQSWSIANDGYSILYDRLATDRNIGNASALPLQPDYSEGVTSTSVIPSAPQNPQPIHATPAQPVYGMERQQVPLV